MREAYAYCTLEKGNYAFYHPGCGVDREIPIYINTGVRDIARVGLALEDIERLVRAAIAAYNESGAPLPRLTYGGRVTHDTLYERAPNQTHAGAVALYKQNWATAEPDRPLGITIQTRPCPDGTPGYVAEALALNQPDAQNIGFDTIKFTPFLDPNGNVCPRAGESVNCTSPPNDQAPVPVDAPCMTLGEEVTCDCSVGPQGVHRCQMPPPNLPQVWTGCLCTEVAHNTFNLGDGAKNPLEPDACDNIAPVDFLGVLMHELGHTLGMNHSEKTECGGLFAVGDTQGIMRPGGWHVSFSRGRRPHADDLEGLIAFFDSLAVPWKRDFQVAFFESLDSGQTWGPAIPVPLPTTGVRTRPAVTSATDDTGFQAMAFADAAGDVYHLTRDAFGFHPLTPEQAKVPGAFSRFPVAVAYGGGRLMVAWLHQESFKERESNIRWAIRDTDPNGVFAWTFGDYRSQTGDMFNVVHKEIGLGYDPSLDKFILSAIREFVIQPTFAESVPMFVAVDPTTGQVFGSMDANTETPVLRSIGKPVCHTSDGPFLFPSHCALPVVAALAGGPELQMLYVAFALEFAPDVLTIPAVNLQPLGFADHGLVDLAADVRDPGDVRFVGAFTDAVLEAPVRFEVFRTRAIPATNRPLSEPAGVEALVVAEAPGAPSAPALPAWPAAIGSQWVGDDVVFSAWRIDPAQSDVAPGETTDGDEPTAGACEATTTTENPPTTTDDPPTTSATSTPTPSTTSSTGDEPPATGTGPGDDPSGCDCRTSNTTPLCWSFLLFPMLSRRWRQRHRTAPGEPRRR